MGRTRDHDIDSRAAVYYRRAERALVVTQSKTKRPYLLARPGVPSQIAGLAVDCHAYTATITLDACFLGLNERITAATFAAHSTPEQLATGAFVARVNGTLVEKGAATAITFSDAHVVAASKYGIILIQMNASGTVSTKVPSATQSYDTAAAALAALPSADSGNLAVAYIAIANNAGAWTANTDDLTNGSDLTTATFTNLAVTWTSALSATIAPVAGKLVEATISTTAANSLDNTGAKDICVLVTTDGTAAITAGQLIVKWRGTR